MFVSFDADRVAQWLGRSDVRAHGCRLESAWQAWAGARRREQGGFPGLPCVIEQRNDFLDRALVVPTVGAATVAFFDAGHVDP